MIRRFLLAMFLAAASQADEPPGEVESDRHVIPLKEVWAYGMAGTREMTDALRQDGYVSAEGPLLRDIRRNLDFQPDREQADPGFAVAGEDMVAMKAAHAAFTTDEEPRSDFSESENVAVVFFSYECGRTVQILDVERDGFNITIRYSFVPHEAAFTGEYFAIIPLGQLNAGHYVVKVERAPLDQKYVDLGFRPLPEERAERIVSRSFTFDVEP